MKRLKRAVLCILCIFVAVMSLASCNAKKTEPVQSSAVTEENPEKIKEAQNVAGLFMESLCKMDSSAMAAMCSDADSLKKHFPYDDFSTYVTEINLGGISSDNEQKKLSYYGPLVNYYTGKVMEGNSYTIKETSETNNGYEVLVTVKTCDAVDLTTKVGAVIKEDILETKGSEISRKLLEKGTVNESSTEEEMISALYAGAVEEMIPMIDSAMETSRKISGEYVLCIVEKDGKMLVDVKASTAVFALSTAMFKIY